MPNQNLPDPRAGTGAAGPLQPGQGAFGQRDFGQMGGLPNMAPQFGGAGFGGVNPVNPQFQAAGANIAGTAGIDPSLFVPMGARAPFGQVGTAFNPVQPISRPTAPAVPTGTATQNQQLGIPPNQAGGALVSPEDVDFLLQNGLITPQMAENLRQVALQNQQQGQQQVNQDLQQRYDRGTIRIGPNGEWIDVTTGQVVRAPDQPGVPGSPAGIPGAPGGAPPPAPQPGGGGGQPPPQPPPPPPGGGGGQPPAPPPPPGAGGQPAGPAFPTPQIPFDPFVLPGQPGPGEPGHLFPNPVFEDRTDLPYPFNSLPVAEANLPVFEALSPGFGNTIPPGFAGFDPEFRGSPFNLYSGIFANNPFDVPGKAGATALGTAANLSLNEAIRQEQRNQAALALLGNAAGVMGSSPALAGSLGLSDMLARDPFTTSSDALQAEIEGSLTRRMNRARAGTLGALSDAQAAAGTSGGEGEFVRAGADFGTRAELADTLAEARVDQALRRQRDIEAAQGQFMGTGQMLGQQLLTPSALYAEALGTVNNPQYNALIEQIRQMGAMGIQRRIAEGGSSVFQTLGPILGGVSGLLQPGLSGGQGIGAVAQAFQSGGGGK